LALFLGGAILAGQSQAIKLEQRINQAEALAIVE
jgi:hypothetical protein